MKISAHTLVRNEERFLWYSVTSVIDHLDKMLLWDMGSDDKTVEIIKILKKKYPKKISTKFLKSGDIHNFTEIRQQMLDSDKESDWIVIVDGDEIWWNETFRLLTDTIRDHKNDIETIVSSYYNCIGDLYHYQDESMGKYKIDNKVGHLTIRAMNQRSIKGLKYSLPHGQQGIFDGNDKLIQERSSKKRIHLIEPKSYMHMTHLRRSNIESEKKVPKRFQKYKYNKGKSFPLDFYYPEAFFVEKPDLVENIWEKRSEKYEMMASFKDFARFFKNLIPLPEKSGY